MSDARLRTPAWQVVQGGMEYFAAEFGLVLRLRGMTVADYLASRDAVSGAVYYLALLVFAAMPSLVRRERAGQQ